MSDPQLKIKIQSMTYRWTFRKGPVKLDKVL